MTTDDDPRTLSTVEWMTALALGCNDVPIDVALAWVRVIKGEHGKLFLTEDNLRQLVARVQELRRDER
jgi:hypothetical protein